jgi:radical SAM protein with 4Fe4S-binding SPASM domain
MLFWESTVRCNLACVHCRRLDVADAAASDDLTGDEFRRVLDSAATLGRPVVVFSGGEPLTRDDWEPLAAHATALGLPIALATNGTLVDDAMAGRIAAASFRRVSVSLDGADAATHDAFRGVSGAFERALRGIAALRARGVSVQVNATVAAHNAHQLDELHALARSLDAAALHLFLLVPVGCGVQIAATHQLPPATYERVLNWILDRQQESGATEDGRPALELKATCAPHYYRLAAQRGLPGGTTLPVRGPQVPSRGCLCGVSVVFVSHKGEVFPCGYLPVNCGSVRERSLAEIWADSPVFADMRDFDRLSGKCGRCEFRGACGGCRARAYALTGDYLSSEPACTHRPERERPM